MKSFRHTPRSLAIMKALEERGVGEDATDRIRKAIECLGKKHGVKVE
jgi:hypothetical protein